MHKVPNLYRNRLGTHYLRITVQGRDVKRSLAILRRRITALDFAWRDLTPLSFDRCK